MPHKVRALPAKGGNDRNHVVHQQRSLIRLGLIWSSPRRVATLIWCHDGQTTGSQSRQHTCPFAAVLRESVQEENWLTIVSTCSHSVKYELTPDGIVEVDFSIFYRHGSRLRPFLA